MGLIGQYACALSVHIKEHIYGTSKSYTRPNMNELLLPVRLEPTPTLTRLINETEAPSTYVSIPSLLFLHVRVRLGHLSLVTHQQMRLGRLIQESRDQMRSSLSTPVSRWPFGWCSNRHQQVRARRLLQKGER